MAHKVDIEKAKKKAAEEAARTAGSFGVMPFWQPKPGKNTIRVMPPWTGEGNNANQFWREVWIHWGVGPDDENKKNVSCPRKTPPEQDVCCPVCDEVDRLKATGDPADLELAKQMKARLRIYSNVIDLKDPVWTQDAIDELIGGGTEEDKLPEVGAPKIQVFSYGSTIWKALLDLATDDVDFTDLEEGHDVLITKEGKGINTKYRLRLDTKASKAPFEGDEPTLHNLDNLMQVKSEAEIRAILEGLDPDEVKQLEAAQKKASAKKQLAAGKGAGKKKDEEEEAEGEGEEEAEAEGEGEEEAEAEAEGEEEGEVEGEEEAEAEAEAAPPKKGPVAKKKGNGATWPPLDADGWIDWDKVTDEQIEDPANEAAVDAQDPPNSVHINCFGTARQRNPKDQQCKDCPLFDRCGARIVALDEAAKKKAAPGKKPVPGKPAGKPAPGKKPSAGAEDLEEQMRAAVKHK